MTVVGATLVVALLATATCTHFESVVRSVPRDERESEVWLHGMASDMVLAQQMRSRFGRAILMVTRRQGRYNSNPLGNAIQRLIELQALAQMQIAKADERTARLEQEGNERFARLEREITRLEQESRERFARIDQTLAALMRMLEQLPDAVREKIGFATPRP